MGSGLALAGASLASGVANVAGGFAGMRAANNESQAIIQQADATVQESRINAAQTAQQATDFRNQQLSTYAGSGVTIQGSPALVLERTRQLGQQQVDALLREGQAQSNLYKMKAMQTRNSGRSAFLGSITGALSGGIDTYLKGRKVGLYGASKSTPTTSTPPSTVSGDLLSEIVGF